jgi:hypothetical protein
MNFAEDPGAQGVARKRHVHAQGDKVAMMGLGASSSLRHEKVVCSKTDHREQRE